ncbi:hypothetical protein DL98DRAFT_181624 [Cadophora sp. DSE1049]|nr:hypothetical protein DL98DRAFT_181624 [Cadophora sp. DSE1049]
MATKMGCKIIGYLAKAIPKTMIALCCSGIRAMSLVTRTLTVSGLEMMEGNPYCQEVRSVKYLNVGKHGDFCKEVIGMDHCGSCPGVECDPEPALPPTSPLLEQEISIIGDDTPSSGLQYSRYGPVMGEQLVRTSLRP